MEKRFKLRFCRLFQSSFFSCRSKKNSDIIITNKPFSKNLSLIPSKPTKISSKPPQFPLNSFLPHPASPPLSHLKDCLSRRRTKKSTKPRRKKHPTRPAPASAAAATEDVGGVWWYGSSRGDDDETEDETETLFSTRSLTSDSSVSRRRRRMHCRRRSERDVKDGFFAVVTSSSDPYKDFKASMAEMVAEKNIFGGKELEELLQCFISLNSRHYHTLIFQVYSEIKQALFLLRLRI